MLLFGSITPGSAMQLWQKDPADPGAIELNTTVSANQIDAKLISNNSYKLFLKNSLFPFTNSPLAAWIKGASNAIPDMVNGIGRILTQIAPYMLYKGATVSNIITTQPGRNVIITQNDLNTIERSEIHQQLNLTQITTQANSTQFKMVRIESDKIRFSTNSVASIDFGTDVNGNIMTDKLQPHTPGTNHTKQWPVYNSAGVFQGYIFIYS